MCLYFSFYSLEIIINNLFNNIDNILFFKNDEIIDIIEWFKAYLILDVFYMIFNKSKRWDLYIHHIWCLINFIIANYYNCCGFSHVFVLINESISIVSGIDSFAMENNNMNLSKYYKKIRINIIKYIRRPIWIISIFLILYNKNKLNIFIYYHSLLTCIIMLYLDYYWYKKCVKVLNKKYLKT
jgi:hypothetical protein